MRNFLALMLCFALLEGRSWALYKKPKQGTEGAPEESAKETSLLEPDIQLIDVPTAGVGDVGSFGSRTRFFSEGGIMEWLNFGVFPRVNIGTSFNVDRLVGAGSPVQITRPDLQLKLRFYDGDPIIPAFALGFDGQGYLYNRTEKRYNQRQRGLYVVGTQEIGLPGLQMHAGMNISDFDTNFLYGFLASSFNIQDKVELMAEWDNLNNYVDSRFNLGLKVFITQNFHLTFAGRSIGQGGSYSNGVSRGPERIVQFWYTTTF